MPTEKREKKKVLFVALNEFNDKLLKTYSDKLKLKSLQRVLALNLTKTYTEDEYSSDFLEPWVQWVSIHTGSPSKEHHIKHLGDVPHLNNPQIWEKLSDMGVSSGIWAAMNASKGNAKNCKFFLPDPWTASEGSYPGELSSLLELLRYSTKNYLNTSMMTLLPKVGRFFGFVTKMGLLNTFRKQIGPILKMKKKYPGESFVYISPFDFLSTHLFLKMNKKYQPDYSMIFLNSLAHLQHHHWPNPKAKGSERLEYGLKYLDRCFEAIFDSLKEGDTLIVANALSQKNTHDEKPWILYRQKDQTSFLKQMGISFNKVEAHMTHDAHIHFDSEKDTLIAKEELEKVKINNQTLFEIETYPEDRKKLFYKIIFTDEVDQNATLTLNGKSFRFFDLFGAIVKRTGKHIQTGTLLTNHSSFPEKVDNHQIFDLVVKVFEESQAHQLSQ